LVRETVGVFDRDEPLAREGYARPALAWMVMPALWLLLMLGLQGVLPPQRLVGFVIVWVPYLLAVSAFVSLSMRRLRDLGAPRGLAWLALVPGAALPLYSVLAVLPGPARPGASRR
jgi:uncharacterized membrane protein YhaH (DUF805 family)